MNLLLGARSPSGKEAWSTKQGEKDSDNATLGLHSQSSSCNESKVWLARYRARITLAELWDEVSSRVEAILRQTAAVSF